MDDETLEAVIGVPLPANPDDRRDPPMAVRLPPGMRDEVRQAAKDRGLTPNALAVRALRRELAEEETPTQGGTTSGRTP